MRRLGVLFILAIFSVIFLTPILTQNSFADVYVNSEKFNIKIELPKSWYVEKEFKEGEHKEVGYYLVGTIYDNRYDFAFRVVARTVVLKEEDKFDSWANKEMAQFIKKYVGDYNSEIKLENTIDVKLASNHVAKVTIKILNINHFIRPVWFVYFTGFNTHPGTGYKLGKDIWYIFIAYQTEHLDYDLDTSLKHQNASMELLLSGVGLIQ